MICLKMSMKDRENEIVSTKYIRSTLAEKIGTEIKNS